MANPEAQEKLDNFDKLTVFLYRLGIGLSAVLIALTGLELIVNDLFSSELLQPIVKHYQLFLIISTAISSSSLHLYDKHIRWFISFMAWLGTTLFALFSYFNMGEFLLILALGFTYVSLSAIAMKESFCFRIRGLKTVPILLALSLLPRLFDLPLIEGLLLSATAILFNILNIAKWRMPFHFDIGDKSRYQN